MKVFCADCNHYREKFHTALIVGDRCSFSDGWFCWSLDRIDAPLVEVKKDTPTESGYNILKKRYPVSCKTTEECKYFEERKRFGVWNRQFSKKIKKIVEDNNVTYIEHVGYKYVI